MVEQRLSDEQFQEFLQLTILMSDRKGLLIWAADELNAYRAGEIVPPGKVLVAEADLRALIEGATHWPCIQFDCPLRPEHDECPYFEADKDDVDACRAALLAHFNLPPEPDLPEKEREDDGRVAE